MPNALERAISAHGWGTPELLVRAPGRVNLIGEHTDYNDGFTMPMALPFDTVLAVSRQHGASDQPDMVTIESEGFGGAQIDPAGDPRDAPKWARYIAGVVALLQQHGIDAGGWRATVATDIPTGASLSSSASIEVATAIAALALNGESWPPIELARLGQRVENEVIGIPSGIMDQFISAAAVDGHVSLMDCRELTLTSIPLPHDVVVAIMDTGTRRLLADAAYGERRASCEEAAAELGIGSLRDATLDQVATIDDQIVRRRAHHVVTENQRTLDAADAMRRGDSAELGRLMSASHTSLRDDYEVSGAGLDHIVDVAMDVPGCLGARMTGGGFAGCAVALVLRDDAAAFTDAVLANYNADGALGDVTARVWICAPAAGAGVITG